MGERIVETASPNMAMRIMGWDGPMWRYRNPWGPWTQGEPPAASGTMTLDTQSRSV